MEKIYLWKDASIKTQVDRPSIVPVLIESQKPAPAVLVIPGGGYGCVCSRTEGGPAAYRFNKLGYHAFVLDYRTAPASRWPEPQLDAMRAMKMIRANSKKWNVDPDRVYVCGFSAGGHLAGSLGVICDRLDASCGDDCDAFSHLPDAMILCYGVLAFEEWSHRGTMESLLGKEGMAHHREYSLPEFVNRSTPPAFLYHTILDQVVPYQNSIKFAEAMAKAGRPCQLALNNWGCHGMLLARNTLDSELWPEQADRFLKSLLLADSDPEFLDRYTHKYQADHIPESEIIS